MLWNGASLTECGSDQWERQSPLPASWTCHCISCPYVNAQSFGLTCLPTPIAHVDSTLAFHPAWSKVTAAALLPAHLWCSQDTCSILEAFQSSAWDRVRISYSLDDDPMSTPPASEVAPAELGFLLSDPSAIPFLTRLPFEMRQKIYPRVIADSVILLSSYQEGSSCDVCGYIASGWNGRITHISASCR